MEKKTDQLSDYEMEICLMVTLWDPVPKTFAICCRMRLLDMLAMETLKKIRHAAERLDTAEMHSLFESFRRKYDWITGLPPK